MPQRILFITASEGKGAGASTDVASSTIKARINSGHYLLAQKLTAAGFPSSAMSHAGSLNSNYYTDSTDISYTTNAGTFGATGAIGNGLYKMDTGEFIEFTVQNADTVDLGITVRTYGTMGYSVDGGAVTSVSQSGTDAYQLIRIDLGSVGTHTVRVESLSNPCYIASFEAWDSSADFIVTNWGAFGYDSVDFDLDTRPWFYRPAVQTIDADTGINTAAVVLSVGKEDILQSVAQADYETNMNSIIDNIQTNMPNAEIFLVIESDMDVGLGYVPTSLASIATAQGATLLDSRTAPNMSDYATANANNLMYDAEFPNIAGHNAIWDTLSPDIISGLDTNYVPPVVTSTLPISFTNNEPSGSWDVYIIDASNNLTVKESVNFSSGDASISLSGIASGVACHGHMLSSTDTNNTAVFKATTISS